MASDLGLHCLPQVFSFAHFSISFAHFDSFKNGAQLKSQKSAHKISSLIAQSAQMQGARLPMSNKKGMG